MLSEDVMNRRELNELLGPMKRAQLMAWAVHRYEENAKLQRRIANQRATYRRFAGLVKSTVEGNRRRHSSSVPENVPRIGENCTSE
jgi:hypothetical protein